jgi:formylglycine-generating enzyme required for sulfatase activity
MGQEIFYCCKCQAQIRSADFIKGGALKLGDRACCVKCGPTLLATLTPKEQEQFFREAAKLKASSPGPGTSRQALPPAPVPTPRPLPRRRRSGTLAWAAGLGAGVVILGLWMASGNKGPAAVPPSSAPPRAEAPRPTAAPPLPVRTPAELREEEAARQLDAVKAAEKLGRFAPDEIRRRYAQFAQDYADTPQGRTIAGWLNATREPKPAEPAVAEVKPEPPKVVDAPKPPETPKPPPVDAKLPEPPPTEAVPKPPAPPRRLPVPDVARQREAEAAVRKTFNPDQAKTPKDKADLARTLLETATSSGAKDVELYVLLRQARLLAAQGGDVKSALDTIDRMSAVFDVEGLGEKLDLFTKATVKGAEAATWAAAALDVAEEASEADDYETAVKLAGRAEALGRGANDRGLQESAKERGKELADLKRIADGLKGHFKTLEAKPDDPAANAAVGKFAALVKWDWKRGLSMLSKGSEPAWKALAERELGNPADPAGQAALGEAWLAQAEKETPTYKARARARAADWLSRALPGLTGLAKVSTEKKLVALGPAAVSKDRLILDLGAGVRMELVAIKAGVFTMGGTQVSQATWEADERPEHRVTLTRGYYLGKYEVTRGQFAAFVKATGHKTDAEREGTSWGRGDNGEWSAIPGLAWHTPHFPQGDDHPVMCVSWNDAKAFCDWASKKTGRGVRLPTEAEWEHACRAGTKTGWSFGDDEAAINDYAWTIKNGEYQTHPVGQKKPNPWGLFDMHGNVWEWCQDWSAPYGSDAVDPAGPSSGDRRSVRGGRWDANPYFSRASVRGLDAPSARNTYTGFRVALY